MVQEAVVDRGCDHWISEQRAHSAMLRFEVISMAPVSWRQAGQFKERVAASGA
jgi:hypothetical protein